MQSPVEKKNVVRALDQWRRGEDREASFRSLVESFYRPLHRFFEKRGRNTEDAHDLTQETFVRIYQHMDTFRHEAGFETWLFTIAANVFLKAGRDQRALKRGAGQQPISLDDCLKEPETPKQDPLRSAIRAEELDRLRQAMDSLPPKMRTVLKLSVYQDRSRQEIADALGVSTETVKAHLQQARKRLAEALVDREHEPAPVKENA